MTTTHTPGPWTLGDEPDPLVYGPTGPYIAQVLAYDRDDRGGGTLRPNYAADAALIAAAPLMVRALEAAEAALQLAALTEDRRARAPILKVLTVVRNTLTTATGATHEPA